jgi:hypothetical protein
MFNTRSFLLQTVGAFVQIQTLAHQLFKLQSSNGEPRPSSPGESYSLQAHSVLLFSNPISNFSFCPLLFLIGSSHRNLDSRRGSINILFPRARRNFRSFWVHCRRIPEDSLQDIIDEAPRVAGHLRMGLCPQLQAGEIGIRGYLKTTAPKQRIGTTFVFLIA